MAELKGDSASKHNPDANSSGADAAESHSKFHKEVQAFVNSGGAATKGDSSEHTTADAHIPSADVLLQQLRADAQQIEKEGVAPYTPKDASDPSLPKDLGARVFQAREKGVVDDLKDVKSYTPQQLKDINDIASAAENPQKLAQIIQRFDDATKFEDLQTGLRLALESKNGPVDVQVSVTQDKAGHGLLGLDVFDKKSQEPSHISGRKVNLNDAQKKHLQEMGETDLFE